MRSFLGLRSHVPRVASFVTQCPLGFAQADYAGVARILKLDPGLSEAVIAVKLQEVRGVLVVTQVLQLTLVHGYLRHIHHVR